MVRPVLYFVGHIGLVVRVVSGFSEDVSSPIPNIQAILGSYTN